MAKRGRSQKKGDSRATKKRSHDAESPEMDDEIDTFHKQRDIIPLDVDGDVEGLSDDDELPVLDDEAINDNYEDEEEEEGEDDEDGDIPDKGLAAKIVRQAKYLRSKFGELDDEPHDEEEHDGENKNWGGRSGYYYGGTRESSGDEAEKEEQVVREMQSERAKHLSVEDFVMQDVSEDENDRELTLEEISVRGTSTVKGASSNESEESRKDLNFLSRKEQMDAVHSSAPELVGLLSELNDALEQLESRLNPLLSKVKAGGIMQDGGIHYLEVKQQLLLAYCQAITFYLLLKSEGQPVRDHPVISRLVDIKCLLDKVNQIDEDIPSDFEDSLKNNHGSEIMKNLVAEHDVPAALTVDSVTKSSVCSLISADVHKPTESSGTNKMGQLESLAYREVNEGRHKKKDNEVGVQSMGMLKLRDDLMEKLKKKGVLSSLSLKDHKAHKHSKPLNQQLETYDDFDDDAIDVERGNRRLSNGHTGSLGSNKLSQLVAARLNKSKFISGDDDLPKRDDIGERRRKHELRVLASAGIKSEDDVGNENAPNTDGDVGSEDDAGGSDDDLYKQVEQNRAAKLATKAEIYKRIPNVPSLPETVEGKRVINRQIEKNRGLTRARNKSTKNPRVKYRTKHVKADKRRKGQVRDTKKPTGPYAGEATGINTRISRSIRLNS